MITRNNVIDALTKCSGYNARNTPVPSDIVVEAWLEHFSQFPDVTGQDLLDAVRDYFTREHDDRLVEPVTIGILARKYSVDRVERSDLDSAERLAHEALCDSKAAEEDLAIESAAAIHRHAVESYAKRFGISGAEAEARMKRSMDARNELDAKAIEVAHRRQSAPPAPVPCPDCGSTAVPCPCEADSVG
jgi:hypothetical protein